MSFHRNLTTFSPNGEHFAYSSPDGCLKIWEFATGFLKQEYIPSSHLSATCSSLAWGRGKNVSARTSKKSRPTSDSATSVNPLQLIAMGTLTGDVMLYSFVTADLHTFLTNGHNAVVNDVCWSVDGTSLFTCSNDQHIIEWDIYSSKVKTKWKADKVAINSLCVINEENLLAASTSILWWNIKRKVVLKSFSGHATEVFRMMSLFTEDPSSNAYFLSSAVGDRVINAWQLSENKASGVVASFVCASEPANIQLCSQTNEPLKLCVVTKEGSLHLFEHSLNGRTKKPLQPKFSLQIASKSASDTKPRPVPVLAANISEGLDSCLLVYGNFLKPAFEQINLLDNSTDLYLIRDLQFSSVSVQDFVSKVKQVEKPNEVKNLAPGHMTDASALTQTTAKKRKKRTSEATEMSMEEHLNALDLNKIPKDNAVVDSAIQVDSMVHLLLQGLQSKDNNMLNSVLQNDDEVMIRNSLRRLPIASILAVLKELYNRMQKRENKNQACLKWLSALLTIHLPFLMSCRDVGEYLGPISQLIEARIENFSKMSRLRGCLNLLLSQVTPSIECYEDPFEHPLVEYQSESSSSDEEHDDILEKRETTVNEMILSNSPKKSMAEITSSSESESEMET